MPVINRHIINPDINYDGANRDDLFRLINRWKRLLIYKEIRSGDVMALGIFDVNLNHIACLFAAAELRLKIFIIAKPIAKETLHVTKMAIFGPVDITISQRMLEENDLQTEMFERYSKQVCYEDEIDEITNDADVDVPVSPGDALIFASTSGTTGASKPYLFTHDEVYKISQRNISAFGYTKQNVVQQIVNMHHVSAMLSYLLPTLMACDVHYSGSVAWFPHHQKKIWRPKEFVEECLTDRKVDTLICSNSFVLDALKIGFSEADRRPNHRITINMSGFPAGQEIYDMTKEYPIDFLSHYGSVDTGVPLLVNKITQDSVYEPGYVGKLVDDFYKIVGNMIYSELWSEPRSVADALLVEGDRFYYGGRNDDHPLYTGELKQMMQEQFGDHSFVVPNNGKHFIVLWNKQERYDIENGKTYLEKAFTFVYLNKEDFMVDTKVSMEQLRAYLEHHYAL
jgi:acyl-CoA synthetase (AMP-forming)/AMP-acid ligase II